MALSRLDSLYMAVVADHSKSPHHHGDGCTISTASSSMMTDAVIGKTKEEALELAEIFSLMIQGDHKDEDKLGEAKLLAGVSKFPQRIKCATLSWNALKKAIERSEL